MRILVVEDEKSLALVIKARLEKEKYMVDIATDGEDGLYNVMTNAYDLVILDVMLPYVDGFTILSKAKKNNITAKFVMLTAKSMIEDKLNGLNNGADDYITKPFHIEEVVARINNLLRKNSKLKDYIEYHDLRLNLKDSSITCTKTNESINIVCKEFQLLEYFMNNPNQIISKEQIYDKVWGIDNEIESKNLEAYLSFIRKKLKLIGTNVNIKSTRGLGYKMEYEDEKVKE